MRSMKLMLHKYINFTLNIILYLISKVGLRNLLLCQNIPFFRIGNSTPHYVYLPKRANNSFPLKRNRIHNRRTYSLLRHAYYIILYYLIYERLYSRWHRSWLTNMFKCSLYFDSGRGSSQSICFMHQPAERNGIYMIYELRSCLKWCWNPFMLDYPFGNIT